MVPAFLRKEGCGGADPGFSKCCSHRRQWLFWLLREAAGSVWYFLTWSACCADTVQSPGPLSLTLVGSGLSEAAVCGACGTGHSGWPLVAENIPFLGGRILYLCRAAESVLVLTSRWHVLPHGDRHEGRPPGDVTGWKRNRGRADGPAVTPHVIASHLGLVT